MKNNLNKQEAVDILRKKGYDAEINGDMLFVHCGIPNAKNMLKIVREIGYLGSIGIDKERGENVETTEKSEVQAQVAENVLRSRYSKNDE